ncbi:substrate-binding domain-containing protein [Lentibacillus sp. N15]|uniref:sugar ABC transporter substrate-binding protein n=1 Tax=Lentibacillus songyuanensis TaxID=3136161 RepID=UPI0031B9F715
MKKIAITTISFICVVLSYFTFLSAEKVFKTDWELPQNADQVDTEYRIVLITQGLETPFWDKVEEGALEQAAKDGASLGVWGSYGNNQEFLNKIETAIYSRVDGIIVQGLDTNEFKALTKFKAASYGIPIITVANDVPMEESLRRTYVGSDQYLAGQMIAKQLVSDMGHSGEVVLMYGSQQQYYQKQRLDGLESVLKNYPEIKKIDAKTNDTSEQVITVARNMLNKFPDVNAFIAVNADISGSLIQEIESRTLVDNYYIYSFDDDPESLSLLKQGKLNGMVEQSPKEMGEISVHQMIHLLNSEKRPLDLDGYLTDIRILKPEDVQ